MEIVSIRRSTCDFGPSMGPQITQNRLLIHGYHSSDSDALDSYSIIQKNLDRLCSGLLWPGMDLYIEYPIAEKNATESGWRLKDLIKSIPTPLTIQTHSLGARVACEALNYDTKCDRLILSAAAIGEDRFNDEFKNVLLNVRRIDVAWSANDPVLRDNYPAFLHGAAMGRVGAKSAATNVFNHNFSSVVSSHGGYKNCDAYFEMWRQEV
jgi:esterase/lipase superfamily enzyme